MRHLSVVLMALLVSLLSSEALTPTSRWGLKYSAGDTLIVEGKFFAPKDSLFHGGRKIGNLAHQDSQSVTIDSIRINASDGNITLAGRGIDGLRVADSAIGPFALEFSRARGTVASPDTLTAGDRVASFRARSYGKNSGNTDNEYVLSHELAHIVVDKDANGRINAGTALLLGTSSSARAERFRWLNDGRMGVNTSTIDSTLTVVGSGRFSTNLRVGGVVHIGNNADSAAAHDLVVQTGTAWSRMVAGEAGFEVSSDDGLKTGFVPVDTAAIRSALLSLSPPRQWQYTTEALRHEPHLALIRADSSQAAVKREADERLAQEEQDGRTLVRASVEAKIRAARTASVVKREADYIEQVARRAAVKRTGWTAQELYPLAQAIRPESASPTSTRLTDWVIGLVVTTQAQQGEIDGLKAAVYDEDLGGVPLAAYVLALAAVVAGLSGYVATLKTQSSDFKKQINDLEARVAKLEGVAPVPPNPEV